MVWTYTCGDTRSRQAAVSLWSLSFDQCPGYGIDASLGGKVWERALKPILWLPTLTYRMGMPSGLNTFTSHPLDVA